MTRRASHRAAALPILVAVVLPGLVLLAAGCSTGYGTHRMEFDSITGFEGAVGEPESMEFPDQVRRWPWPIRQIEGSGFDLLFTFLIGIQPTPREVDDPGRRLRLATLGMAEKAGDDLGRIADATHRLLWLAAYDLQPLDQMTTLSALESLLVSLGADPLKLPQASRDAPRQLEIEERALTVLAEYLGAVDRARRDDQSLDLQPADRDALATALAVLAARPSPHAPTGRRAVRMLLATTRALGSDELREVARYALADRCAAELAQMLRIRALAQLTDVRLAAIHSLVRLSGPHAVAYTLAQDDPRRRQSHLDIRRTWVRLCGGVPIEYAERGWGDGPSPLEFLFDTIRGDEDEGLRLVATDAMARLLGRPVSLDPAWVEEFWRARSFSEVRPLDAAAVTFERPESSGGAR